MGCGGVKVGHEWELRAVLNIKIVGEGKACGRVIRGGSRTGTAETGALGFLSSAPAGMGRGTATTRDSYKTAALRETPQGVTGREPLGFLYVVRKGWRAEGAGWAVQLWIYQLLRGLSLLSPLLGR